MSSDPLSFQARLAALEERIQRVAERCGRSRASIKVVAVSKKFSAQSIQEAYGFGLRHFGENYVQEFAEKKTALVDVPEARFHLIGHLQSNKAKIAIDLFDVIQTVDSIKLMQRLDVLAAEKGRTQEMFFEIKLSSEGSKTGADPGQLPDLMDAAHGCSHVRVLGLMTIPPWSEDPEQSRSYFRQLAELARRCGLPELSMGMSNDCEAAIEEGATMIRVGTALFGARPKPNAVVSNATQ